MTPKENDRTGGDQAAVEKKNDKRNATPRTAGTQHPKTATVIRGWRVVVPPASGKGKPEVVGKPFYVVRTSADSCLAEALKAGHKAVLETVWGVDNAGPFELGSS